MERERARARERERERVPLIALSFVSATFLRQRGKILSSLSVDILYTFKKLRNFEIDSS